MLLVRSNVEVNCQDERGLTPLHHAVIFGDCNLARLLLERNANIDAQAKDGWTPLHVATNYENLKLAAYLLEQKANANAESGDGRTPLHYATIRGSLNLTKLLLERKAKIDCPDKKGWRPLHLAAECGHVKVAQLLLDKQAHINITSNLGWTPLHIAVYNENNELARLLVEQNAEVNCISKVGDTPLRDAILNGNIDTVEFLTSRGADLSILDSYGRTCADWLNLLLPMSMRKLALEYDTKSSISAEAGLRQAAVKILSSLLNACDDTVYPGFSTLGRCLLFLGMDEEAKFAFEQAIIEDDKSEPLAHRVICDICEQDPIIGARFVCRTCPDTDLCSRCMLKYPNSNSLAVCKNHGFIEFNPHGLKRHQDSQVKKWLVTTLKRFQ
ncbi:MAG: hypothetical protein Q9214_005662 [Letrouitia sp. 1 TL-2023]